MFANFLLKFTGPSDSVKERDINFRTRNVFSPSSNVNDTLNDRKQNQEENISIIPKNTKLEKTCSERSSSSNFGFENFFSPIYKSCVDKVNNKEIKDMLMLRKSINTNDSLTDKAHNLNGHKKNSSLHRNYNHNYYLRDVLQAAENTEKHTEPPLIPCHSDPKTKLVQLMGSYQLGSIPEDTMRKNHNVSEYVIYSSISLSDKSVLFNNCAQFPSCSFLQTQHIDSVIYTHSHTRDDLKNKYYVNSSNGKVDISGSSISSQCNINIANEGLWKRLHKENYSLCNTYGNKISSSNGNYFHFPNRRSSCDKRNIFQLNVRNLDKRISVKTKSDFSRNVWPKSKNLRKFYSNITKSSIKTLRFNEKVTILDSYSGKCDSEVPLKISDNHQRDVLSSDARTKNVYSEFNESNADDDEILRNISTIVKSRERNNSVMPSQCKSLDKTMLTACNIVCSTNISPTDMWRNQTRVKPIELETGSSVYAKRNFLFILSKHIETFKQSTE